MPLAGLALLRARGASRAVVRPLVLLLALTVIAGCGQATAHQRDRAIRGVVPVAPKSPPAHHHTHPVAIWMAAPSGSEVMEQGDFTCRVFARVTATGSGLSFRLANDYSDRSTQVAAVTAGVRDGRTGPAARSITPVSFDGRRSVTLPAQTSVYSDPVPLAVHRGQSVVVSIYVKANQQEVTFHKYRAMTNYCTHPGAGDRTRDQSGGSFDESAAPLVFLSGVVAQRTPAKGAVVWAGDSVAEGDHLPMDAYLSMVDRLAARMRGRYAVLNASILGNAVIRPFIEKTYGTSLRKRLASDVLSQPGVRLVVINEGANDVRHERNAQQTIRGLRRTCAQLHERHLSSVIMTLQPSVGFGQWLESEEQERQKVNAAIRDDKLGCDRLVDMAAILTGADGRTLRPDLDGGDHLHPNVAGQLAVARAAYPVIRKLLASRE